MSRLLARGLLAFALVAAVVLILGVVHTLSRPALTPQMPTPNGFDDFVQAAHRLTGDYSDLKTLKGPALQSTVSQDAEPLRQARLGFSRDCRVPLPVKSTDWVNHATNFIVIKQLASAIVAEGMLAETQGRTEDAVRDYLDIIHLAHESTRGGIIIHGLVGLAIEAMGEIRLEKLLPSCDAKTCRSAAQTMEEIEAKREPAGAVLDRERLWVRHAYGLAEQIAALGSFKATRQVNSRFVSKANAQAIRSRQLEIEFAARAYQLEQGSRPTHLIDLIPAYLKSIPQDPLTGTNLVYRP